MTIALKRRIEKLESQSKPVKSMAVIMLDVFRAELMKYEGDDYQKFKKEVRIKMLATI
ncbi:MAG: hypothetical protein KAI44_01225 [Methylococcales bacterium]|nr:hypothetical protein [Methylococcales bacterium]